MASPDFLDTLTSLPVFSSMDLPMRVGAPPFGSISIRLERCTDASFFTIPPFGVFWLGLVCLCTMFTPSTNALYLSVSISRILPSLPREFPATTFTKSPFFNFIFVIMPFKIGVANLIFFWLLALTFYFSLYKLLEYFRS